MSITQTGMSSRLGEAAPFQAHRQPWMANSAQRDLEVVELRVEPLSRSEEPSGRSGSVLSSSAAVKSL
jgi:hypothetical protein